MSTTKKFIPISSSNIKGLHYDEISSTLSVQFLNDGVYDYHNVPKGIYDGLNMSDSKGTYLRDTIVPRFKHTVVTKAKRKPNR